ncbi:MAG: hypothetical protein JNL79_29200 [Myxococcales bacterium]|nr:hypothetical protein [Myxococcales bacterium]
MRLHGLFAGGLTLALALLAPARADAAPGTCKCNSGCHANPAQCVKASGCNIGYAPSCGFRGADGGIPECPKTGYISCNGDCTCEPIPGFCETIGGADYCDAGPKDSGSDTTPVDGGIDATFDSSVPDTTVTDGGAGDSAPVDSTPTDGGIADSLGTDSTAVDTFVPDTAAVDSAPDVATDTPTDACVPLECPAGTKAIPIPGECDPFCAPPCGTTGEFKCAGLTGTVCTDGFCVPKCLVSPCPDCKRCSLGDGLCFDDPTACDGGVGDGGDGGASDASGDGDDGGASDATIGDAGADGAADGATDADLDGGVDPLLEAGSDGGCGCATPRSARAEGGLAAIGLLALAGRLRRRRR